MSLSAAEARAIAIETMEAADRARAGDPNETEEEKRFRKRVQKVMRNGRITIFGLLGKRDRKRLRKAMKGGIVRSKKSLKN